ncbi:MAG: hypothetical protein OXU81_07240 [Gammaproteobacteria bacterium]|nr:hypothetical protein [Gammaproteobacteria bacterium]
MRTVHDSLTQGRIEGFYSVTMLTIEGMMRKDRADVFAGTRTVMQPETSELTKNVDLPDAVREKVGEADVETVRLEIRVEQPDRKPLHPENAARVRAAKAVGLRVLKAVPRLGAFHIKDPSGEYYLDPGKGDALKAWDDRACAVARAIEARGVGMAQIKELGERLGEAGSQSPWFRSLDRAEDIHEEREVERAFGEWADGDSIAAHIAYGIDVFCSDDFGKSNAAGSILDHANRAWLSKTYGVQFATLEELAGRLP